MHLKAIDATMERVEVFAMSMNMLPVLRGTATILKHVGDDIYSVVFDGAAEAKECALSFSECRQSALLIQDQV